MPEFHYDEKRIDEMNGFARLTFPFHFVFSPSRRISSGVHRIRSAVFLFQLFMMGCSLDASVPYPTRDFLSHFLSGTFPSYSPPFSFLPFSVVNLSDHSAWIPGFCASLFFFFFFFLSCDSHLDQRWRSCCGGKKMGLRFYCRGMLFIMSISRPCQYQGNECYYILHVSLR